MSREVSSIEKIKARAKLFALVREFFVRRGVSEVETPLLMPATNPAPYLNNFVCDNCYLQTSPEFAMKRLLAAGSGDIYQICKAFRKDEVGRFHNPEFTILEWYRLGFDHRKLMAEVAELLQAAFNTTFAAEYFTYKEIFLAVLNIDPYLSSVADLKKVAQANNLVVGELPSEIEVWLQLLFTHLIEPQLGMHAPVFIYDYPASQAMLAKVRAENPSVASRFEVYFKGVELANGFHELSDAKEQRRRFQEDLHKRQELGLPPVPIDEQFLQALERLPNCAGVALGIDRLLLLVMQANSLQDVLCFPFERLKGDANEII